MVTDQVDVAILCEYVRLNIINVVHLNESQPNALVLEPVCDIEGVFKPAHLALRSNCSGNALLNTITTVFNCLKV